MNAFSICSVEIVIVMRKGRKHTKKRPVCAHILKSFYTCYRDQKRFCSIGPFDVGQQIAFFESRFEVKLLCSLRHK